MTIGTQLLLSSKNSRGFPTEIPQKLQHLPKVSFSPASGARAGTAVLPPARRAGARTY